LYSFCFVLQAEDGIRVFHVTGVQTCALPIFPVAELAEGLQRPGQFAGLHYFNPVALMPLVEIVRHPGMDPRTEARLAGFCKALRSEERRGGKACRCRWWRE